MSSGDSSDDFFSSFDQSAPPKPTPALRPSSSSGNVPKAPPPPPPPPPPAGPIAGTSATTTKRPPAPVARPPSKPSIPLPPKPQQQQQQQQQQPTLQSSAAYYGSQPLQGATAATTNPAPTPVGVTGNPMSGYDSATSAITGSTRPRNAVTGNQSRISSGGANSRPMTTPSYYGTQEQQQQKQHPQQPTAGASTLMANPSSAAAAGKPRAYPQYQATSAGTVLQPPSPTFFNPAATATAANGAYQPTNAQQPYPITTSETDALDSAGDWFKPDTDHEPVPPKPPSNPYAQTALFRSSSSLEGNMDNAASSTTTPTMFVPTASSGAPNSGGAPKYDDSEFANEPPLLEELGINIDHILLKVKAVVIPFKRFSGEHSALLDPKMIVDDADLAGPTAFALLLGGELLLTGKIHFGYIYGFGVFGCLSMTLILNLMSPKKAVSIWTVASILGYSLIPVNILAALKILLVNIANLATLGRILAFCTILWSTTASTRLLEVGCEMQDQRYLLAYPIALLYSAFVLITIF